MTDFGRSMMATPSAILQAPIIPNAAAAIPTTPLAAEDAAGDGGEAVATFSTYNAPLWARRIAASYDDDAANAGGNLKVKKKSGDKNKNNNNDKNDAIILDNSNDGPSTTMKTNMNTNNATPSIQQHTTANKNHEVICIDCDNSNDVVVPATTAATATTGQESQPDQTTAPLIDAVKNEDTNDSHLYSTLPSHSSPACESGLLASVVAPEPRPECLTVLRQLQPGTLSPLQIEGVGLAIQRHCRLLATPISSQKIRAGFFLGDGAGIGKGRQIAALLRDSLSRSVKSPTTFQRRRHLWLSVSRELIEDARRDLTDVGCHVPVLDGATALNNNNHNGNINKSADVSGVLFVTYALLTSGKGKRLEDIIAWLTHDGGVASGSSSQTEREAAFDGCLVLDEAHKAKNLCGDPPTATGLLVLRLQERLPNARVMYCSATGVSDLRQMAYAVRLGLWGPGTNFAKFENFRIALEKRGVGAMELLALEMKRAGCFVARTLSWDGAEFQTVTAALSNEQRLIYDKSMDWWDMLKRELRAAVSRPGMNGTPRMLWGVYWAAHQRFCKELAICAKVPLVVEDALKQLEMGHSVVVGLQSTGEASTQATLEDLQAKLAASSSTHKKDMDLETVLLPGILSTAAAIMAGFVRNHFPVSPQPMDPIPIPTPPPEGFSCQDEHDMFMARVRHAERINNMPEPGPVPELVLKRQQLLDAITQIPLPPAPLDDLIDRLGGVENVAEMTGRSGRVLRHSNNNNGGDFRFTKRVRASMGQNKFAFSMPVSEEDTERLNIVEKKKFMDGRRRVAIISDAASTGISLHAAKNSGAKDRRRVHYTIELPWAADKAIQQLGRTHRSGQVTAPIYQMVVSDLGGERRFAAAVAKRMASLGALTKGDRRAATGSDLSEFDIDSKFGRRALKRLYDCMVSDPPYTPSKGSNVILDSYIGGLNNWSTNFDIPEEKRMEVLSDVREGLEMIGIDSDVRKKGEVKVFLNRISALTFALQNLVFALFASTMDDVINEAKATGEFEGSVEDIRATSIELSSEPESITTDVSSGAPTKLAIFNVDRGCSLVKVSEQCRDMIPDDAPEFDKAIEVKSGRVARSGFYMSRRQIMGRTLVVFAVRRVQLSLDENEDATNRIDYDPMGMMVLTRPNTGTNPYPMPTDEFLHKYRLVASIDDVKSHLKTEKNTNVLSVLQTKYASFSDLWERTFDASNRFEDGEVGLAPRHAKLGIVSGAVLHCLKALEKSVVMRSLADRSLKIIRVETSDKGQRLVGMKFPVDYSALLSLRENIAAFEASRGSNSDLFIDEDPDGIQAKSVTWITTAPKTMKSFFQAATKVGSKRSLPDKSQGSKVMPKQKVQRTETKKPASKKVTSITSFFKKASDVH